MQGRDGSAMSDLIFLKLGGSLITDKTGTEALRSETLGRLCAEIAAARNSIPNLRLLLGHGSGSFGHVAAARHGTRMGVSSAAGWQGFAQVGDAAARLNRFVIAALLREGVPAVGLPPSATAAVADGVVVQMNAGPILAALDAGLLPVIYGDVAFDSRRGGTVVSTEEVMNYLASALEPSWLLLAGETRGVLDPGGKVVPHITRDNLPTILPALGGSHGTDVTGGMASKVESMLSLVESLPDLSVRIFSGLEPGLLHQLLIKPGHVVGTLIGP